MAIPLVHAPDLRRGIAEPLSPRVTRLIADNPGPFTYTGSGTYILRGDGESVIVDPGPEDRIHQQRLVEAAVSPIRTILITHTHRDHSGGAAILKKLTGARILGFGRHPSARGDGPPALDEGGDHSFEPDETIEDNDLLSVPGLTIRALHTPGHISNHLCFALEEERALFTGDHIMGWATTVVAPPDGDMTSYMDSLDLLLRRDDVIYYPTHGAPITEPRAFVEAVKQHRLARDRAILDALANGIRTIREIVETVYEGLSPTLKIAAGLNVKAHLDAHVREGRVAVDGEIYTLP